MDDEGSRTEQLDPEAGRSRLERWLPAATWAHETLDETGILLALAAPQSRVEERLRAVGFVDRLGAENVYRRVEEGKDDLESRWA